jgi:hypothetical protein
VPCFCLPWRTLASSERSRPPSCPTRMFVPIVTGCSVLSRNVRHGTSGRWFLSTFEAIQDYAKSLGPEVVSVRLNRISVDPHANSTCFGFP